MPSTTEVATLDWNAIASDLHTDGYAVTPPILGAADCRRIRALYSDPQVPYRKTVDMGRYNYGLGEYKYFDYPLPPDVTRLRTDFYAALAPIANEWCRRLRQQPRWPDTHSELLRECHSAGQQRPTPLLLRYAEGDFNCLHQDLYGSIHFPLQVIILLNRPDQDFEGGELVLVEQRPRLQSRPIVVPLQQGAAAIIPVRERPREGPREYHRAQLRHGVSRLLSGNRHTLGLIFHDAKS